MNAATPDTGHLADMNGMDMEKGWFNPTTSRNYQKNRLSISWIVAVLCCSG